LGLRTYSPVYLNPFRALSTVAVLPHDDKTKLRSCFFFMDAYACMPWLPDDRIEWFYLVSPRYCKICVVLSKEFEYHGVESNSKPPKRNETYVHPM
jgi:hypothetical protein